MIIVIYKKRRRYVSIEHKAKQSKDQTIVFVMVNDHDRNA